jgi:hypothetical protein
MISMSFEDAPIRNLNQCNFPEKLFPASLLISAKTASLVPEKI